VVQKLSDLYKAYFKKVRGKASKGWIRPTIGEYFMTHKDFTEIINDPLLTYPGSTHRESEVIALGGEVFDTGNGTIGRVPLSSVPSGWSQAENWQRYSKSSWGGDDCGRFKSYVPTEFSNKTAYINSRGAWWANDSFIDCSIADSKWHVEAPNDPGVTLYWVNREYNTPLNRVEIGIY
jgi:hypothetical protein